MDQHFGNQQQEPASDTPLVIMFRHNLWANLSLLDACAALDGQQLAASMVGAYGTLYDTLKHIVGAEQGYLIQLTGRQPANRVRREDRPDIATLRACSQASGEGLIAIAAGGDAVDFVNVEWDGGRWPIPAGLILTQAINHATEHRAQILTILTQFGIEPPDLSGWAFSDTFVIPIPIE